MPNRTNRHNKSSHKSYKRKISKKRLSRVQRGRQGLDKIIYAIENGSAQRNETFNMCLNISPPEARKIKKYLKKTGYDYSLLHINNHYKLTIIW